MARRRYQSKGRLYKEIRKEATYWRVQFWEDVITSDGRIVAKRRSERIGPASGPGKLTEKQARSYVQHNILAKVNANRHKPQSAATVEEFVRRRFIPEYLHKGENPAHLVESPEMVRGETFADTMDQCRQLLEVVDRPLYEMIFAAIDTGLRAGGLRWFRVNLTSEWAVSRGESLAPFAMLVREQIPTNGESTEYVPLKGRRSPRTVPLSRELASMLAALEEATEFNGPEHPVFSYGAGVPVNTHNVSHRVFPALAKRLRMPVSSHVFRHTHATMLEQTGMSLADRRAQLGHGVSAVTMDYTHSDLERRRQAVGEISATLLANEGQTIH